MTLFLNYSKITRLCPPALHSPPVLLPRLLLCCHPSDSSPISGWHAFQTQEFNIVLYPLTSLSGGRVGGRVGGKVVFVSFFHLHGSPKFSEGFYIVVVYRLVKHAYCVMHFFFLKKGQGCVNMK